MTSTAVFAPRRPVRHLAVAAIVAGLMYFLNTNAQTDVSKEEKLAKDIVEKADRIRFPDEGFQVDVAIANSNGGQVTDTRQYRVLSKGNENTIVFTEEPAVDRGQAMLMRGRDLWIFLPSVSQPVRLSLSQRLTGQVANGDLARANFAGDYNPKVLRTETLDGESYHVLELTAVDRGVTYSRVLYWVKQSNGHPHKAEFYSVSDRLLKTCKYESFKPLGGRVRPTRLVMQDALKAGDESVLEYSDMQPRDLPDKMFTKDYLKRL
jgi:outer membrane lipoprotein-sorting protein